MGVKAGAEAGLSDSRAHACAPRLEPPHQAGIMDDHFSSPDAQLPGSL